MKKLLIIFFYTRVVMLGALIGLCIPLILGLIFSARSHTTQDVPEWINSSIVQVYAPSNARATGFHVWGASGKPYIVTVDHICYAATKGRIKVRQNGHKHRLSAKILKTVAAVDLCLIESPFPEMKPLPLRYGWSPGESITAYGYSCGRETLFVSNGSVLYLGPLQLTFKFPEADCLKIGGVLQGDRCFKDHPQILYTTYEARPGMSGGPVINNLGFVVGMTMARLGILGSGAMIPAFLIVDFLKNY